MLMPESTTFVDRCTTQVARVKGVMSEVSRPQEHTFPHIHAKKKIMGEKVNVCEGSQTRANDTASVVRFLSPPRPREQVPRI